MWESSGYRSDCVATDVVVFAQMWIFCLQSGLYLLTRFFVVRSAKRHSLQTNNHAASSTINNSLDHTKTSGHILGRI